MPNGRKQPAEERFWLFVNKETGNDCWEWIGSLVWGYGQIKINKKMIKGHRFSYELHHGPIPEGMVVMHSCDNRKCVNPLHLSIGTPAQNNKDKVDKNRQAKGSAHAASKLNEEQVKEIREKLILGLTQRAIAKEYKVSQKCVCNINTGKNWTHVNV